MNDRPTINDKAAADQELTFADIPEGADFDQMPLNGFGRVLTHHSLYEVYFKISPRNDIKKTLLVAIGQSSDGYRFMRWWYYGISGRRYGAVLFFAKRRAKWVPEELVVTS